MHKFTDNLSKSTISSRYFHNQLWRIPNDLHQPEAIHIGATVAEWRVAVWSAFKVKVAKLTKVSPDRLKNHKGITQYQIDYLNYTERKTIS